MLFAGPAAFSRIFDATSMISLFFFECFLIHRFDEFLMILERVRHGTGGTAGHESFDEFFSGFSEHLTNFFCKV
jgi:hypothetical protein